MPLELATNTKSADLKKALTDALGYCRAVEMQLRHRQADVRCVEATENARQAAHNIRAAMDLAGVGQ